MANLRTFSVSMYGSTHKHIHTRYTHTHTHLRIGAHAHTHTDPDKSVRQTAFSPPEDFLSDLSTPTPEMFFRLWITDSPRLATANAGSLP